MVNNKFYFKRNILSVLRVLVIDSNNFNTETSTIISSNRNMIKALTFNEELNNLGYTLKPKDIIRLSNSDALDKCDIYEVGELIGHVKAKPMYPNYPTQVMEMDEATFRFHQICHYFSTYGLEMLTGESVITGWLPDVEDTEKTKTDEALLDLKVLDLMNFNDAVEYSFRTLASRNERLTIPETQIIDYDILNIDPNIICNTKITFKENLYTIFYSVFTSKNYKDLSLYKFCQHTGDIWKCIDYIKFYRGMGSLRTTQRKVLVKLLESYSVADFKANLMLSNRSAELIKHLLNYLSYNKYSRSPAHKEAVRALRNKELISWEGKAKALIFSHDDDALKFIAERPGMMLRMITILLRNGYSRDDILNELKKHAAQLSTQTLVTLLTHFGMGNIHKYNGEPYDELELLNLNIIISTALWYNLGAKNIPELRNKKVYLDMDNYNLSMSNIECNTKSAEGGYVRSGLAYKIPDTVDRLRFFVYWNDKERVDVDLHGSIYYDNGTSKSIGWNKDYKDASTVFSGDITHSNAAEYLDVDLKAEELSRVEFNINLYSGKSSFGDIDECFVGIMGLSDENYGNLEYKLYDAKNCFFSHYLKNSARTMEYGYIDVKRRCIVFIGKEGSCYDSNLFSRSSFSLKSYINYLLYDYNDNRTAITKDKDEADVILTMEKSESDDPRCISLLDNNFFMDR